MQYAIVDGVRREASRELSGTCPVCGAAMTPRCGRFRVAHWAHPPGIVDHRWEPETEWHRKWKACFPEECQEVIHQPGNGEKHIADVKTGHGRVIEFQNSPISEEERRSREAFYRPMYWVVNGQRLKWDRPKFFEALGLGRILRANPLSLLIPKASCLLLRKWENSAALVLFDFGDEEASDALHFGGPVLWALQPGSPKSHAVLIPIYRSVFIEALMQGKSLKAIDFSKWIRPPDRRRHFVIPPRLPPRTAKPPKRKRYASRRGRTWSANSASARRGRRW